MKDLLKKIKNIIQKLLEINRIHEKNQQKETEQEVSNSDLMEDIVGLFKYGMEKESVGTRLLYPMSFYILMNKDDYDDRKKALPIIVPEIVKKFYAIIKQKEEEYQNVEPVSKKWVFQFSPCQFDSSVETEDKDVFTVSRGNIMSTCELYNDNIDRFEDLQVERNIKVSIKCKNSQVIKTGNLNLQALAGVDILEEGFFTYKFDEKRIGSENISPTSVLPPIVADNKPFATLSYDFNGMRYTYEMKSSPIYISGRNDTRSDGSIFKVESVNVINGHVSIRQNNGSFEMCAFAETRKNEILVPISEPDNLKWVPLPDNSAILMNGDIQVTFKKL